MRVGSRDHGSEFFVNSRWDPDCFVVIELLLIYYLLQVKNEKIKFLGHFTNICEEFVIFKMMVAGDKDWSVLVRTRSKTTKCMGESSTVFQTD